MHGWQHGRPPLRCHAWLAAAGWLQPADRSACMAPIHAHAGGWRLRPLGLPPTAASPQIHTHHPQLLQRTVTGTRSSMTLPSTSITSLAAAAARTTRRCPEAAAAAGGGRHPLAGAAACRGAAGAWRRAAARVGGAGRAAAGRDASAAGVVAAALESMVASVIAIAQASWCGECRCKRPHCTSRTFGACCHIGLLRLRTPGRPRPTNPFPQPVDCG